VSLKSANEVIIGQRYANAFFSANVSQQDINQFLDVGGLLANDASFLPMLKIAKGKSLNGHQKTHIEWIRSFSAILNLSQKVTNFLMLIALKKRLPYLSAIVKAVQHIANKKSGCDYVTLVVVEPISDIKQKQIIQENKNRINIDEPILNIVINPELLGGYIIKTRSVVVDNSLKKQIEKLHNVMKGVA
jgi:F-type H+-transporting ATPase subunit delta